MSSRVFTRGLALAVALAWAAATWPGTAAADHDRHGRKKHHDHRRTHFVLRLDAPRCRPLPPPPARWGHAHAPRSCATYYDPYCRAHFSSLTFYVEHLRGHTHAALVWALNDAGTPLYACRRTHEGWVRCDD